MLYFEDHEVGVVRDLGSVTAEAQEMIAFAARYDPQVFHVDPVAAKDTSFGGLVASGWYTGCLAMRLIVDNYMAGVANLGSPGMDEVRWFLPVRPGDRLSVRHTVLETRRSVTKPDRGVVRGRIEVLNQDGAVVMSWKGLNILRCREAGR